MYTDGTEEMIRKNEELTEEVNRLKEMTALLNKSFDVVPDSCKNCINHPSNGGSGICHCILGSQVVY